jgi:hypothetical protein
MSFSYQQRYSVRFLELFRPEINKFAQSVEDQFSAGERVIAAIAGVKSGKRIIKIALALRNPNVAHIYCGSLNRKDEKAQLDELESYGLDVYVTNSATEVAALIASLKKLNKKGTRVIVHFNESDYGTGTRQRFAPAFKLMMSMANVSVICYSATNEELLCGTVPHTVLRFVPPANYCGAEYYLAQGLIQESTPFWDETAKALTVQGHECVNRLLNADSKTFGVVRFASKMNRIQSSGHLVNEMTKLGIHVEFISAHVPFDWSKDHLSYLNAKLHQKIVPDLKVLLVVNQTCTRSTEVSFHEHIAFWHDYRSGTTPYNTMLQASGRPFHYQMTDAPHNIRVYGSVAAFELAAGQITIAQYNNKISQRVTSSTSSNMYAYQYEIVNHKPTRAEVNSILRKHGLIPVGGRIFNQNLSKNNAYDLAASWFGAKCAPHSHRSDHDVVLSIDAPAQPFQVSWANYVVTKGYQGKYAVLLPHLASKPSRTPKPVAVKSIFA